MIIIETITIDGREFTHTYSDTYTIRKVGTDEIYIDAMDVLDFEYEETDTLIPGDLEVEIEELRQIIDIILGDDVIE